MLYDNTSVYTKVFTAVETVYIQTCRCSQLRFSYFSNTRQSAVHGCWRVSLNSSVRSLVVDAETMRPGHDFGSVLMCLLQCFYRVTGRTSRPWNTCATYHQKLSPGTSRGRKRRV